MVIDEIISNSKIILLLAFIILVLITFYYNRSKHFEESNLGQLIFSFLQGVIIALIFPEYFQIAPIFALTYYFLSIRLPSFLNLSPGKLKDYNDKELIHELNKISEIENLKFIWKKYSGKNSMNAFYLPRNQIILGDELISNLTTTEKIVVIAHEIGHILNKDFIKISIGCFVLIIILSFISIISYPIVIEINGTYAYYPTIYFLSNFMIFISGILGVNLILWHSEYNADKKALQLTKDKRSLESALTKLKEGLHNKDYGIIINLIVYDHPLIKDRIKRSEKFNL